MSRLPTRCVRQRERYGGNGCAPAGISEAIDAIGGRFELTYATLLCLARRR